jgi:hypothetical protein
MAANSRGSLLKAAGPPLSPMMLNGLYFAINGAAPRHGVGRTITTS